VRLVLTIIIIIIMIILPSHGAPHCHSVHRGIGGFDFMSKARIAPEPSPPPQPIADVEMGWMDHMISSALSSTVSRAEGGGDSGGGKRPKWLWGGGGGDDNFLETNPSPFSSDDAHSGGREDPHTTGGKRGSTGGGGGGDTTPTPPRSRRESRESSKGESEDSQNPPSSQHMGKAFATLQRRVSLPDLVSQVPAPAWQNLEATMKRTTRLEESLHKDHKKVQVRLGIIIIIIIIIIFIIIVCTMVVCSTQSYCLCTTPNQRRA
jgi:hypothetical protein